MYKADCENDNFEVIDGQQRTISIYQYIEGDFTFNCTNQSLTKTPNASASAV